MDRGHFNPPYNHHLYYPRRAYSRAYSAKVRADPEKRRILNEQKRDMMRRLAKRRELSRELAQDLPPPVPRKKRESLSDGGSSAEKKAQRRDYQKYYEENKDRMRKSNRSYYARVMADPERRAQINEKKKLAMRRLKERRRMEWQGPVKETPRSLTDDDPVIVVTKPPEFIEMSVDDFLIEEQLEVEVEEELVDETVEELVVGEEGELKEEEQEQEVEEAGEENEPFDVWETFPFTISAYQSIMQEERANFSEYIEKCAREYFQPTAIDEVVEELIEAEE